jgi:hypothetical protein
VLSDYLSLGSDRDFLLVPMSLDSALAVASRFGFMLPTQRMVDLIYREAQVRLLPQPLPASDRMRSVAYLQQHDALVEQQRGERGAAPGARTAGPNKDLGLSARRWQEPGRLAIYGWQRADGTPIQPLSTVHGARYADYSHGVRLVSQTVFVNGAPARLLDALADAQLGPLLSDEGALPQAAAWLASRPGSDASRPRSGSAISAAAASCSSESRGDSWRGCACPSRGCRARRGRATGTSPRGHDRRRRRTSCPSSP